MSPARTATNVLGAITARVRWFDLTVSILGNLGAVFAFVVMIWVIFSGQAMDKVIGVLKSELGTEKLLTQSELNTVKITTLTQKLDDITEEIRERFPVEVSEIDYDLSFVEDGCRILSECTAIFFASRYPEMTHCSVPVVNRHTVIDSAGTPHPVRPGPGNIAQKLGPRQTRVPVGFIPGDDIHPGRSFFQMVLIFMCAGQEIEQTTRPLEFFLLPQDQ